ncbi:MAG: hypothetical protein DI556_09865 [Rhodovulum sulfidophilum]|uniref:Tail fiber protein n=1 Tax=Rhodovulum sulfidophilum TaxID=35806 RepID=A0A2W5PXZ3_RHOSU|nr:MAG: hypothetical protein DI556_09865 [Rhodovulum sulfidophilum]
MSTDLLPVWGATGTKIQPDPTKVAVGWTLGEKPPYEYMNWWQAVVTDRMNSILQEGPAPWSATTSYALGALVSRGGIIYRATTPNTNSAPPSANWLAVTQDASSIIQGTLNKARLPSALNPTYFQGASPQVILQRTDNTVNAVAEFRTTTGSVFAGQGNVGIFAVGVTGVLSTVANVRFSVDTASGNIAWTGIASGKGGGITELNASALAAGTVPPARISGAYSMSGLTLSGASNLTMTGGDIVGPRRVLPNIGGTTPSHSFAGAEGAGMHVYSTLQALDLWFDSLPRLRVGAGAVSVANGAVFTGSGAGLTSVPAASLTGILPNARLDGDYGFGGLTLTGALTASQVDGQQVRVAAGSLINPGLGFLGQTGLGINRSGEAMRFVAGQENVAEVIAAGIRVLGSKGFIGDGSGLTKLDAGAIATGKLADGRLPDVMSPKEFAVSGANAAAVFSRGSGVNIGVTFKGTSGEVVIGQGASGVFAVASVVGGLSSSPVFYAAPGTGIGWTGTAAGNGSQITALNADNLGAGTVPNARMSGAYSFGALTLSGNLSAAVADVGRVIVNSGSAAAPAIGWPGYDGVLGIYRSGSAIVLMGGGSPSLSIGATSVSIGAGVVLNGNGSGLTGLEASNVATGFLNAARLPLTNAARDWVGDRIAAIPVGAVGSTCFLGRNSGQTISQGDIIDGAQLHYSSVFQGGGAADVQGIEDTSARPSGQWKALGRGTGTENNPNYVATNFVRVA